MMLEYASRSPLKELIDGPLNDEPAYEGCLKELDRIGRLLGAHRAGLQLFEEWLREVGAPDGEGLSLLDLGCGGGPFARQLVHCFRGLQVTGADTSAEAIAFAQSERARLPEHEKERLRFVRVSEDLHEISRHDFAVATLVAHHIPDQELPLFLKRLAQNSRMGFALSDLHRHRLAHASFRLLCTLGVFRNPLVRHDGPLSVKRAFVRSDFETAFARAGLLERGHLRVKWSFPFRWMLRWTAKSA